jgi:GNAT superfamily N-acetyltransferase
MRTKIDPVPAEEMFAFHVFYLGEVCVLPEHSPTGIGTALLRGLIEAARKRDERLSPILTDRFRAAREVVRPLLTTPPKVNLFTFGARINGFVLYLFSLTFLASTIRLQPPLLVML